MEKKESIKKGKVFYYKILPAYNIDEELIYSSNITIPNGSIIKINIKGKEVYGCSLKTISKPKNNNFLIKSISNYIIRSRISLDIFSFIEWFSMYNITNRGYTLKQFLPNEKIIEPRKQTIIKISKTCSYNNKNSSKKLYNILEKNPKTYEQLDKLNYTKNFIKKLVRKGELIEEKKIVKYEESFLKKNIQLKELNKKQLKAFNYIRKKIQEKEYKPLFLDGLTGSGKTEVYFKIIEIFLNNNKQVLVLLPEIGLTEQWIKRFKEVFNFSPYKWNSSVTYRKKNLIWNNAINGEPLVVVGTRSALFLPFKNLGIIIIDEENDSSYKQEDQIIYNARDMAIVRAKFALGHVLLVSATPSLETYQNCIKKKYSLTRIDRRFGKAVLPSLKIINMRKEKKNIFSIETSNEIRKNLELGKQSLILINRRGYAPISICTKCGERQKCPNCDVNLVLHKELNQLICHHCGYCKNVNESCTICGDAKNILHVGLGIEKVFEEAKKLFNTDSLLALSSDTFNRKTFKKTLEKIENNEIKILIGTQIISKGFNFMHLNKIFILDFDMWFYNSDIRTSEKIFQLTQQVAGRAGRGLEKGEVFIQTYDAKNNLLDKIVNNKTKEFYKEELHFRKKAFLPPFSKLVAILLQGRKLKEVEKVATEIKELLTNYPSIIVLGPIPAPIRLLKNEFRFRILVKSNNSLLIQKIFKIADLKSKIPSRIKIKIDVDPYSFF